MKITKRITLQVAPLAVVLAMMLSACGGATDTPTPSAGSTGSEPTATTAASTGSEPTATTASGSTSGGDAVTLSVLTGDDTVAKDMTNALTDAYTAKHPNVKFNIETRPGGTEGDNLVKTRLATGEMNDIFFYNSGSLLQALHPTDTLVDISKEPYIANIQDVFLPTVSQNGQVFGVPIGTIMGGGVLYNKKVFEKYGISVPKTWAEFEANNDKLKAAGMPPVLQTYGDTWTSQLFVLADYYNVAQANPKLRRRLHRQQDQVRLRPRSHGRLWLPGGRHQEGLVPEGLRDHEVRAGLEDARRRRGRPVPAALLHALHHRDQLARQGERYRILRAARQGCLQERLDGLDARGRDLHPEDEQEHRRGQGFPGLHRLAGGRRCRDRQGPAGGPVRSSRARSCPDTVLPAVKDIAAYIDAGKSTPALEFFSPLKGP